MRHGRCDSAVAGIEGTTDDGDTGRDCGRGCGWHRGRCGPWRWLMGPGIGACVVLIGCFQVCLVCLWRLLSRVGAGTIFDGAGAGPVNVIAGCCALAAVLLVAALGVLGLNRALNGGLMLLLGGGALVAAGLTLLVLVLRRLLARATDLQADLVGLV